MNFIQGLVRAPIKFEVTLKPIGMSRRSSRQPEAIYQVTATDKDAAATQARSIANVEFPGYAISKIREVKQ